ncbi:ATP-binding protein [Encephalitozoon cuniculi EcunIII-L]|nr:ATP-binding protein [Encephalitozoon cuniculi EcunIII-L]
MESVPHDDSLGTGEIQDTVDVSITMPRQTTEDSRFCKICYSLTNPIDMRDDLISPCDCKGSIGLVHGVCLKMWRYRGKRIRDIRKCEQCSSFYRLDNEIVPHRIVVSLITVGVLLMVYLVLTILFKSLVNAFIIIIRDFFFSDIHRLVDLETGRGLEYVFFHKQPPVEYRLVETNGFIYLFIMILFYQIFSGTSFFSIFNYMFTFWRLNQFDFPVDKILFGFMSVYYMRRAYNDAYSRIDSGLIFFLNYK